MKVAIYARVSTLDQEPENQLQELRQYVQARSWPAAAEYVDKGVSGSTDRRPALDRLVRDAQRRGFDVLVVWRLDRLGRNLRHLVTLIDELHAVGVSFVSLGEGLDCTTPAGRLQLHVLAALSSNGLVSLNGSRLGWPEPGGTGRGSDGRRNASLNVSWPPYGGSRCARPARYWASPRRRRNAGSRVVS